MGLLAARFHLPVYLRRSKGHDLAPYYTNARLLVPVGYLLSKLFNGRRVSQDLPLLFVYAVGSVLQGLLPCPICVIHNPA